MAPPARTILRGSSKPQSRCYAPAFNSRLPPPFTPPLKPNARPRRPGSPNPKSDRVAAKLILAAQFGVSRPKMGPSIAYARTTDRCTFPIPDPGRDRIVIKFENVTKIYARNARPALDDLTMEVERGEFVFLVGASGSGKSTALRLVLREARPSSGKIHVAGRDLTKISPWKVPLLRRQIGVVFQDFRLLLNKTVFENVAFAQQVIGKPRHQIYSNVPDVLEMVGLGGKEKRLPHELSGGEQQRVAIARAFVNRPPILLADEPTGNLDPGTSVGIMRLLDRINRTGTTVLMATHDDEIVDQMRKRVLELENGVLVRDQSRGVYGSAR